MYNPGAISYRQHGLKGKIQSRVIKHTNLVAEWYGELNILQHAWDTRSDLVRWYVMTTLLRALADTYQIQFCSFNVDNDQDDLITKSFGLRDKVNFRRV